MLTNPWIALYESFAARPFGGNVAGIVVSNSPLDDELMSGLASDILAPTTGFVALSSIEGNTVPVRFYTPTQEIDACGHVTIAVAQAVTDLNVLSQAASRSVICAGGTFELERKADKWSMFQVPRVQPRASSLRLDDISAILGRVPINASISGTGLVHLFIEFSSVKDLERLELDHDRLVALGQSEGVDTIGAFVRSSKQRVRLRDLTAPIGVLEEPASGTTSGALGLLLGVPQLTVEQGFEMGRPSLIHVEAEDGGITVSGTTRRVMSGSVDPLNT